ncbi:MAG: MBL fold metallo-hydrolase [Nocardioidaceae bacterium]
MTYSGHTSVGGVPQVRELADLIITKIAVGPMDNNSYLLRCRSTDDQVLIDAANDADNLLHAVGRDGLTRVVTTHSHGDHWQALEAVVDATTAVTVAGAADAAGLPVPVEQPVNDGDVVFVGSCELRVVHLAGHTPGSIALVFDDPEGHPHVFTGDSLFPGGVGRTTSTADFDSLIGDVSAKLFDRLPDETWVYPGHGDDTTLGAERPHLAEWRARGW